MMLVNVRFLSFIVNNWTSAAIAAEMI